ncbi:uncharacterized protein V6R79_008728 [Siganus canaliculatus]
MPRKKDSVRGAVHVSKIRQGSRLMNTHESTVDYINGHQPTHTFADFFTSSFFGLDFFNAAHGNLHDDLIYSSDDEEDDDPFSSHNVFHRHLEPHPRIRQLTEEEADQHAKELIEEEERRKKAERNKRKKLIKKEKKRQEKENAFKDIPEDEKGKSECLQKQEETVVIESNAEARHESSEAGKTPNGTDAAACDMSRGHNINNKVKEGKLFKMNVKEAEKEKNLDLTNLCDSVTKLAPEEMCQQKPRKEGKKAKSQLQNVQESKEPPFEKEEESNKENTVDSVAEGLVKRSQELAGIGNLLAASGEYEMAVKYFTHAIKYNPKEFKLFGNRSLCYERMQQYENALRDADLALYMAPNWIKGLFRKGKALCGLKRYHDASLIYKEVLQLDPSSVKAMEELKQAQTLHLVEMGFSHAQSSEALKTHGTLEEAVEYLFAVANAPHSEEAAASRGSAEPLVVQGVNNDDGGWEVISKSRPRPQKTKAPDALDQNTLKVQMLIPRSRDSVKPELFSVWVGSLAPAVTYATLHELFSRAGTVHGIKMLLDQQCAFINYSRKEDCDRAIQCINGLVVEGAPLSVRYPSKLHSTLGPHRKECFFWRTTGCTRPDCTYKHDPNHKNIDRSKFTSRLGNFDP